VLRCRRGRLRRDDLLRTVSAGETVLARAGQRQCMPTRSASIFARETAWPRGQRFSLISSRRAHFLLSRRPTRPPVGELWCLCVQGGRQLTALVGLASRAWSLRVALSRVTSISGRISLFAKERKWLSRNSRRTFQPFRSRYATGYRGVYTGRYDGAVRGGR